MNILFSQLNKRKRAQTTPENRQELNGYIANSTVYVTSINEDGAIEAKPTISSPKQKPKSLQSKPAPVIANGVQAKKDTISDIIHENKAEPEKHEKDASEKSVKKDIEKTKVTIVSELQNEVSSVSEVKEVNKSDAYSVVREHLSNGCTEKLLGEQPDNRIRATAVIENNKLGVGEKG